MGILLNKEAFVKRIPVLALRVKTVVADEQDTATRLVLLSESISDIDGLSEDARKAISEFKAEVVPYTVQVGFDQYSTHEVLERLLPEGMDIPSAFETVGHIAHVNLRDEHELYKELIGEVILEKNSQIRTVVNKIGAIESTFRYFKMEVLAGIPSTEVEVQEEGCTFRFDYSKVYWNSRLQYEHRRLVQMLRGTVCDMFCGVGPFALPAAKRGCTVYANDLNPESIHWLQINVGRNKLIQKVNVYNMDAREFVSKAITDLQNMDKTNDLDGKVNNTNKTNAQFDHFVMNLPASAHEFLDVFPKLAQDGLISQDATSTVHCYIFCKTDEDPIEKIESGLGHKVTTATVKRVRDVAPNKEMFCVSFNLPPSIFPNAANKRSRTE
ncbi:tRNA (guanine(37)-N1)-methyltransferase [Paramicrosporidium saccamoebae]|uniref:tRNA (guanine(37)-N1)-methyltransferase n=1 Tax=Paramicrosporidium saccamoebae TaxID=1246581 RepID=A0A2H9TFF2_9FUNG|nr:tRNA (guanine(37)-N1)-methyltransferase [Paramicrosporidium saccamoebae]